MNRNEFLLKNYLFMKTIAKRMGSMLVMASALLLCFSSCKEEDNEVLVASIELEEENISVVVGQTQALAYEILPENATNQQCRRKA